MSFSNILNSSNLIPSILASGLGSTVTGTIETLTSAPPPNNGVVVTPTSGDTPTVTLSTNAISPAVGYFYLSGQSWPPVGQYPVDGGIVTLPFDNSIETAGAFTHASTATYTDITINQTGTYKITFGGTLYMIDDGQDGSVTLWIVKNNTPPGTVYVNSSTFKNILNLGSPVTTYLPISGEFITPLTAGDKINMGYRMSGSYPIIFSAIGAPTISGQTQPGTTVSCYMIVELIHY